jgi:hypothetical protein
MQTTRERVASLRKPSAGIVGAPTLHDYGTVTTAQTIDPSAADVHYLTLGANIAMTFTTTTVPDRTMIRLWLTQDGTGSRTITSWTGVTWLNGVTPTLRTTASAYDLLEFTFVSSLTTWVGRILTDYTGAFPGPLSSTSSLGYATGAGGTITQLTSKSTAVTLNKVTGQITLNNATLNAGASVAFTVNNTTVNTSDTPLAVHASAGTAGAYRVEPSHVVNGTSFDLTITNITGGNLSEAIVVNFNLLRGAAA